MISRARTSGSGGDTHLAGSLPATIRQNVQSKSEGAVGRHQPVRLVERDRLEDGLLRPRNL